MQLWRPYVYWRTSRLEDPVMNIDADGLRRTWNPDVDPSRAVRVFMFGASTLRGHGVRDEFTIPSYTSKLLAASTDVPVVVHNFGQLGYVSTQDLIALLLEIQRANPPDVAVFYNGTLDVESGYDQQTAGIPRYEYLRRDPAQDFERAAALRLVRRSSLAEIVLRFVPGWSWGVPGIWHPPSQRELEALADAIVSVYAHNVRIAEALADGAGFEVVHFWQPMIWSRADLSAYERAVVEADARRSPLRAELFRAVWERVATHPELTRDPRFVDLRDALDGEGEPTLWDPMHTTEAGNERIARRVAEHLRGVVERRWTARRAGA
jgi:lysophospholipase L1-like esterase